MNARAVLTHLAAALAAFGLGYFVFSSQTTHSPIRSSGDPAAEFADIIAISDVHTRTQALLDFFAAADPAWAERLRDEVDPAAESRIILDEIAETLFASWWARTNPEAAFERRLDPAWSNRNPWLREVMLAWVPKDPTRAAQAALTLPQNADRGSVEAARVLVDHWWDNPQSNDPTPLVDLIRKLEVVPRAGAIQRLIEKSVEHRGLDATEKFVESLPPEEDIGISVQKEVMARFAQSALNHDKSRAIAFANKHGRGRDGSGVLRHLAFSWGQQNGPEALEWAKNIEDVDLRPEIVNRVWMSFNQTKPEESIEWVKAQEPTAALEAVLNRYLAGLAAEGKQDEAFALAERAKDTALLDRLRGTVAVGWTRRDPKEVAKWLVTAKLSPETETRVRQAISTIQGTPPSESPPTPPPSES